MTNPTSASPAVHAPAAPAPTSADPPAAINCETAVRRLWDYLDGGLTAPAHGEVEAHLSTCERCPPHFAFATRTLAALAAARPAAPAPDESAALRARVRTALGASG